MIKSLKLNLATDNHGRFYCSILFQDLPVHNHELRVRQTPGGGVHSLRHIGRGDSQHPPLLLRGLLHLPLRHEHSVPAVRVLFPAAGELLLLRGRGEAGEAAAAQAEGQGEGEGKGEEAGGGKEEEGGEGETEEGEERKGEREGQG